MLLLFTRSTSVLSLRDTTAVAATRKAHGKLQQVYASLWDTPSLYLSSQTTLIKTHKQNHTNIDIQLLLELTRTPRSVITVQLHANSRVLQVWVRCVYTLSNDQDVKMQLSAFERA